MILNLRNMILAPVVMAAAALASNAAVAETTLKVPFNFTVAGKVCPAGTYTVDKELSGSAVTLRSKETAQNFRWVLRPGQPAPTDSAVILHFEQAGQSHSLQSVQFGAMETARIDKTARHGENVTSKVAQGQ